MKKNAKFLILGVLITLTILAIINEQKIDTNCFNLVSSFKMCFEHRIASSINAISYYTALLSPPFYSLLLLKTLWKKGV